MKTRYITIVFLLCLLSGLHAQTLKTKDFAGEKLTYRIRYGVITGGEVKLTTANEMLDGEKNMHVKVDMYTTGVVDNIYHLHDVFESSLRTSDGFPRRFIRDAHEGKYVKWEQVDYYDNSVHSTETGDYEVDGRYHDLVSAIYALRCMDYSKMRTGQYTDVPIYYEEAIMKIRVFYQGVEDIKVNGKIYRCHRFAPIMNQVEMFEKKAPVLIWISDDNQRRPIMIRVNFKVGAFKIELKD